jgi:hypothetical protein
MSASFRTGLVAVFCAMLCAIAANATPVDYIFTGVGSGSVGGTTFTDSKVTFTFVFDTTSVPG